MEAAAWPGLPEQLQLPGAGHLGAWGRRRGSLAGESLGYLLGHTFGDRLRSDRLGCRLGERNWAKADALLKGWSGHGASGRQYGDRLGMTGT
jgi:hypothetical protein